MQKDNFYSQLARKSTGYKLGMLALIVGVSGLLYWQFRLAPMQDERDQLKSRKTGQINKRDGLDKKLDKQRELRKQQDELNALIAANEKALPTEAELPTLFKYLQRKAGDAAVTIKRWDYKKEEPVDIYIKVPVEIELTGTFHNIMRYFALLGPEGTFAEPIGPAPGASAVVVDAPASGPGGDDSDKEQEATVKQRIVSIEDFQLGSAKVKDGSVVLTAKFTASTFRQQETAKDDKKKGKGKAKKGKAKKGAGK